MTVPAQIYSTNQAQHSEAHPSQNRRRAIEALTASPLFRETNHSRVRQHPLRCTGPGRYEVVPEDRLRRPNG